MAWPPEAGATRLAAVDAARGVALAGMAAYHLSWDLANFGYVDIGFPTTAPMRLFSHAIAASFLFLAGASLALAHRGRVDWRAFARRLATIGAAAGLVSAASYFFAPTQIIGFGILHCIALASLLCAPLLRAPAALALGLGALALAVPALLASPAFNPLAMIWIGLGTVEPMTLDWRPLLPWGGFVFLGLGLTRLGWPRLMASRLARWRPGTVGRSVAWCGRHSLAIYLLHQPLLFAAFSVIGSALPAASAYEQACQSQCSKTGGDGARCAAVCGCVERSATGAGLNLDAAPRVDEDATRQRLAGIVAACVRAP